MRFLNTLLILGAATRHVFGYGELGHRTVAYLAEKHLTSEAKALADKLLENDQGFDFSDAAVWADIIKRKDEYKHTGAWHYIGL